MTEHIEQLEQLKQRTHPGPVQVLAQLPTGRHKPRVVYDVAPNGCITGSGRKIFLKRSQFDKARNFHRMLEAAGSPCLTPGVTWDEDALEMRFEALDGATVGHVASAEEKNAYESVQLVMPRSAIGVRFLRELEEISDDNVARFVHHAVLGALLNVGDINSNNFIAGGRHDPVIYAVDHSDNRGKLDLDQENFVNLLTSRPLPKAGLLRKLCEAYVDGHKAELTSLINGVDEAVLACSAGDWQGRRAKLLSLLV